MQTRSGFWGLVTLGLIGLAAILAVVVSSMYAGLPKSFPKVNLPLTPTVTTTQTPGDTATITLTARPTWTLSPSETRTITPTPTITHTPTPVLIATLSAARPYKFNDRYSMRPYTPDMADEFARRMRQSPNDRYKGDARNSKEYFEYFRYAVLAYREALLRFPDDWRAENWQWGLTYALAMTGDPQAVEMYSQFLRKALETPGRQVTDLPAWLEEHDKDLTMTIQSLPTKPGILERSLLAMQPGGVFFYYERTPNRRSLWPLTTRFNLPGGREAHWLAIEAGDGLLQIALYQPDSSGTTMLSPRVFSLPGGSAPIEIAIQQPAPYDFKIALDVRLHPAKDFSGLVVSAKVFPACPVLIEDSYTNDEGLYNFVERSYLIGEENLLLPQNLANCAPLLTLVEGAWPVDGIVAIMEQLAPLWPPALDGDGHPYPPGTGEALRERLSVYAGSTTMDLPALYTKCQNTAHCNLHAILSARRLEGSADTAIGELWGAGMPTGASGIFDFNKDNTPERWFTVQHHPNEALEFWLLVQTTAGVRPVFVALSDETSPNIYFSVAYSQAPVFQIKAGEGYSLSFDSLGNPSIRSQEVLPLLTTYTRDQLFLAEKELYSGGNPRMVRQRLQWTLDSGRFNCRNDQVCDRFFYLYALTYEMTGDITDAVDMYIKLWWENSTSPLATIGRLKLLFDPPPTETPTVTPTRTQTPTVTFTPDPLRSSTPTATVTSTPDPLISSTPTPTPTDTPTPTLTITANP